MVESPPWPLLYTLFPPPLIQYVRHELNGAVPSTNWPGRVTLLWDWGGVCTWSYGIKQEEGTVKGLGLRKNCPTSANGSTGGTSWRWGCPLSDASTESGWFRRVDRQEVCCHLFTFPPGRFQCCSETCTLSLCELFLSASPACCQAEIVQKFTY